MRVSDIMMSKGFVSNMAKTKENIEKLSRQLVDQKKVQKPSDDPEAAARIIRMGIQSNQNLNYAKNIDNSIGIVNETTFAMESINSQINDILTKLSDLNNATNEGYYKTFAEQIDLSLKTVLEYANSSSDGKYIFGGTDHAKAPYGFSADQASIETKSTDVSGKQSVKISGNVLQKINMSGAEVFGTIMSSRGNLDSGAAVGDVYTTTGTAYNADKDAYNVSLTFTKTADNTYSLSYDVLDSSSTSIYSTPPAALELRYDPDSGQLKTINGRTATNIKITDSTNHLDFNLDLNYIGQEAAASSVSLSVNQKTDIFNTLIRVRDDLNNGIKPSAEDEQMVKDFQSHLLDKIALSGNITNQLLDAQDLLTNQKSVLDTLLANEQEIDVAAAMTELTNERYMLDMAYKVSASILPKSLLDYI